MLARGLADVMGMFVFRTGLLCALGNDTLVSQMVSL